MVQLLHAAPAQPQRRKPNLILHCAAHAVPLDEVASVNTPSPTYTRQPIPHHQLIATAQAALDLVIRSVDAGVCANSYIPDVLQEWRHPQHDTFEPRNVWSLFNAFTETLKQASLAELPKRTQALHGLLDVHVGLGLN